MALVPIADGEFVMIARVRLWIWLIRNRYVWWLRKPPPREFSTVIYAGLPGSGKTLLMVRDAVRLMRAGVRVYSNISICDPLTGLRSEPCGSWLAMLHASVQAVRDGIPTVFCWDEIHLAADARSFARTPGWWLNLMAQRRHFGIGIIGTTQDFSQVEKRLRVLTSRVVEVGPFARLPWIRRFPLYRTNHCDASLYDSSQDWHIGGVSFTWIPWWAYHGYSSRELVVSDDFSAYSDDQAASQIAMLQAEAQSLLAPGPIPIFAPAASADRSTSSS